MIWSRWCPSRAVKIGVLAGVGVFAGLATGLYLPSGPTKGWLQLGFAMLASVLSGWLAVVQLGPSSQAAPQNDASALPVPRQLPPTIAGFTDREALLASLRGVLEDTEGGPVVVVLTGKAGVGKTAFAVHIARLVAECFPDGHLYVNLRGVEDQPLTADEALAGFLRELGVPGQAIPEQLDERSRMFRSRLSGHRMLLLLDNAGTEAQVRPLLPGGDGSVVLVTSRMPLAGLAARTVAVDVLDDEAALTLFTRVVGARRVEAESDAAARIVGRCGGLPLAVRIAGAKLAAKPHWTLADFVTRLSDEQRRLTELRAGDLEVRASFALSYRTLQPAARRAFMLLGLSDAPDFAPWLLAALADSDETQARDLLETLADVHLVEAVADRYRFHDLLRVFARECVTEELPEADRQAALRRAIAEATRLAEVHAAALAYETPLPDADPLDWFGVERVGLISALDQADALGLTSEVCRLAAALTPFFEVRARWRDWRHASTRALDAAHATRDALAEATACQHLGRLHRYVGELDDAQTMLERALVRFTEAGDAAGQAGTLHHLGTVRVNSGDLPGAIDRFDQAIEMFRGLAVRHGEAQSLRWLGFVYGQQGDFDHAIVRLQESILLYAELEDSYGEAQALRWLGDVYGDCRRYDDAVACFARCLPVFRAVADPLSEAWALLDLGDVHREHGNLAEAMERFIAARNIFRQCESVPGTAAILLCFGDVHRERGEWEAASACLDQAVTLYARLGDSIGGAWARLCVADLKLAQHDLAPAVALLSEALVVFRTAGRRLHEARVLDRLGQALASTDPGRAATQLAAAVGIFDAIGAPEAEQARARWQAISGHTPPASAGRT